MSVDIWKFVCTATESPNTANRWVLHVLAPSSKVARIIRHAYKRLPPELRGTAGVVVTVVRLDSVFWARRRVGRLVGAGEAPPGRANPETEAALLGRCHKMQDA